MESGAEYKKAGRGRSPLSERLEQAKLIESFFFFLTTVLSFAIRVLGNDAEYFFPTIKVKKTSAKTDETM